MNTREFLRRYAWVYCYVAAFFLICAAVLRHSVEVSGPMEPFPGRPVIIIDAGHGGPDGGTTGISGIKEDQVNLSIAKRLNAFLNLLGFETVMTRSGGSDLSTEGDTIRARKQSDLKNRVELVNGFASAVLVSIHQNHFPDSRYSGPQVFYTRAGERLAGDLQSKLNAAAAPQSRRTAKPSVGVYLMEHCIHPAVLVECGFLSNGAEEQRLASAEHQKMLAAVIAASLASYVSGGV